MNSNNPQKQDASSEAGFELEEEEDPGFMLQEEAMDGSATEEIPDLVLYARNQVALLEQLQGNAVAKQCALFRDYLFEVDKEFATVEAVYPDPIELDAIHVSQDSVVVQQEIDDIIVDGMQFLDVVSTSMLITVTEKERKKRKSFILSSTGVESVKTQDATWLYRTRTGYIRADRYVESSSVKSPPLRNFVDLTWHTPVHMMSGKQWYIIHLSNATKDVAEIQARVARRYRASPYKFIITSDRTSRCRDIQQVTYLSESGARRKEFTHLVDTYFPGYIPTQSVEIKKIQGTGLEIARQQCKEGYQFLHSPVLVDDVGLYIDGLGGAPGPYIQDWLAGKTAREINDFFGCMLDRTAKIEIIYAYTGNGVDVYTYTSVVHGTVQPRSRPPPLEAGYEGWFVPINSTIPLIDMSKEARSRTGLRVSALQCFFASQHVQYNRQYDIGFHIKKLDKKKRTPKKGRYRTH